MYEIKVELHSQTSLTPATSMSPYVGDIDVAGEAQLLESQTVDQFTKISHTLQDSMIS